MQKLFQPVTNKGLGGVGAIMKTKRNIGINGLGVITKKIVRDAIYAGQHTLIKVINDPGLYRKDPDKAVKVAAEAIKQSSTYGQHRADIGWLKEGGKDYIVIEGHRILFTQVWDPGEMNWRDSAGEGLVVIDGTGAFVDGAVCKEKHIGQGGAAKVFLTAPGRNVDFSLVQGVNEGLLTEDHKVVDGLSCTTGSIASWLFQLMSAEKDPYQITRLGVLTAHAGTNTDRTIDFGSDRGLLGNIVPGSTGAAKAVKIVLPTIKETVGYSFRHTGQEGSITTGVFTVKGGGGKVNTASLQARLREINASIDDSVLQAFDPVAIAADATSGTNTCEMLEPSGADVLNATYSAKLLIRACEVLEGDGEDPLCFVRAHYPNVGGPSRMYRNGAFQLAGHSFVG